MVRDYVDIGSAPANEEGTAVGSPDYYEKAQPECTRFLNLIRKTFGDEPEGAHLAVVPNPHDFGTYYSVVCHYNTDFEAARDYAFRCEDEAPTEWPDEDPSAAAPKPEPVKLNMDLVMAAVEDDDGTGFCLACGAQASGCEPDARDYQCDSCGEKRVFGAMEVLLMVG